MADDYKYKNLPRAANGIAPAYWDEEEKQWLPYQGGADMVKELNDIKATQAKILERLDEPLDTQLTGSNVEQLKIIDSEVIEGTKLNVKRVAGLNKYRKIVVFARSSIDAPIELRLLPIQQVAYKVFNKTKSNFEQNDTVTLDTGGSNYLYNISTAFEWLEKIALDSDLFIRYQAQEEPTKGSISIYIMGVK